MANPDPPDSFGTPALQNIKIGRRPLLAGLGVAGAGAVAFTVRALTGDGGENDPPRTAPDPDADPTEGVANAPANPESTPPANQAPVRITEVADRSESAPAAQAEGDGLALVSSPRLPLFGIGSAERDALLSGEITNWRELGSAAAFPIELLAIDGAVPEGSNPAETVADYDALAAALAERPGAVAVVPIDQVDFRANVLSIDNHDPVRDRGDDSPLRIAVIGDIIAGRNVHLTQERYGDFTHAFWKVANHLATYDVTIANLECNLSDSLPQPENPSSYSFVTSPALTDGIKMAGIDAVSLANNHTVWNDEDWGVQGLLDTIDSLDAAEIPYFGAGRDLDEARRVWTIEAKGRRIAFLGVDGVTGNQDYPEQNADVGVVEAASAADGSSPGTNPYAFDQVIADVEAAAADHDIVIPYLHMGAEYRWLVPEWVEEAAQGCIDAGATVVVTNHPHVIQGMGIYKNTPIVYSVGNFIFDQMFSVDTRQGLILELDFGGENGTQVIGLRTRGVEIEDFHQPRLMTGGEQAAIMDRFWRSTDWLADR